MAEKSAKKTLLELSGVFANASKELKTIANSKDVDDHKYDAAQIVITMVVDFIACLQDETEPEMSDEEAMMRQSIADTMGSLGIDEIRFTDDDGNDYGGIDCKNPLKR